LQSFADNHSIPNHCNQTNCSVTPCERTQRSHDMFPMTYLPFP